jgi:hypothetical protein
MLLFRVRSCVTRLSTDVCVVLLDTVRLRYYYFCPAALEGRASKLSVEPSGLRHLYIPACNISQNLNNVSRLLYSFLEGTILE